MAIAETAQLITQLSLRDQLTPGLAKARGELSGFSAISGGASNALNTFKSRIGQLAGATGLVGLGAGLFSVVGLMKGGIDEVRDFGSEVLRLQAVTGLSAQKSSELAGVFHHFGIEADTAQRIAGFAEKNLFKYGGTAQAAAKFQAQYGLALRDSSGHLMDFNQFLLNTADYFNNKSIPAQQKAAALALVYSRNWQAIIPVLSAGRAGIAAVEDEAVKFGLTLNQKNLADFIKFRDASRVLGTAFAGLKLQIGLQLIPALKDLFNNISTFLAKGGTAKIAEGFGKLVAFARQAASILTGPVATGFKAVYTGWMAIPSDLRNLIITGFAANKTIKFLFGFDPLKMVFGGIGGAFFQRGAPGNPMWVAMEGGLPGGGGGGPMGGGSLINKLLLGGAAVAGGAFAGFNIGQFLNENYIGAGTGTVTPAKNFEAAGFRSVLSGGSSADITRAINSIEQNLNPTDFASKIAIALDVNGVKSTLRAQLAELKARLPAVEKAEQRIYAANLAQGVKESGWRAREQAQLAHLGVTSLAGNASMNRIQGAVARSAILQSSKLDRLNQLNGVTAGNTGVIARKRTSVSVTAQVNVASTNTFNVNSLATSLVSTYTRVNVGNQYQGKIVPI